MARHSRGGDEQAVNLDSLMDALTNVVAVLILVLILLQADVGKTVERLLGNLPPATPEQIQQAQAKLDLLAKSRDRNREMLAAKPPDQQQLDDMQAQIALLEDALKDSDVRLVAVEKLRQLQARHQQDLDAEKKKTDVLLEEIRKLEAILADTPVPVEKKADVVRIPNSREIPDGANIYYAYVLKDRVHLVDPLTAKKMVMDEFERVRSKMLRETIKVQRGKDRKVYDQDKLVKHFATIDFKVRDQKVTVPYNRPWTRLNFRIEFDHQKGGVTLEQMQQDRSEWHRICNLVRSFPRGVLIFRVRPDGFATYLKAREIADRFNVPCGWEITGANSHSELLDEFEVNRLEEPPPSKPGPPAPPRPKRVLD